MVLLNVSVVSFMATESPKINNPFFTYPTYPVRGYSDHVVYQKEVVRLKKYISEVKVKDKSLLFICVGAAMEEATSDERYELTAHWRQLFPTCIDQIIQLSTPVKIVIVSPNRSFSPDKFTPPVFISKTD